MTIKRIATTMPASGSYELPNGNFFLFLTASAALNINISKDGSREDFSGLTGGLYVRRVTPWLKIYLTGTAGTTFEVWIGDEKVERDETDVRLQVTAIAGVASVNQVPNSDFVDTPAVAVANGAAGALFPVNALRRAVTVFVDTNNVGDCELRASSGGNRIGTLSPGQFYSWRNTDTLFARNDTGASASFYILEET